MRDESGLGKCTIQVVGAGRDVGGEVHMSPYRLQDSDQYGLVFGNGGDWRVCRRNSIM